MRPACSSLLPPPSVRAGIAPLIFVSLVSSLPAMPPKNAWSAEAGKNDGVTFMRDVAEILYSRCADCHREGGTSNLRLQSYRDVLEQAPRIAKAVESGAMPPWSPVGNEGDFLNARRLSSEEKLTIKRWIAAGCLEGSLDDAPIPPARRREWLWGKPDAELKAEVDPSAPESSQPILTVELPWSDDAFVEGLEIRPHSSAFRHALLWLDLPLGTPVLDMADAAIAGKPSGPMLVPKALRERWALIKPTPFRPVQQAKAIEARDRRLVGVWSFDQPAHGLPEGTAWRFPAGSRLIVEAAAEGATYRGPLEIGVHFAASPKRIATVVPLEMRENAVLGIGNDRALRAAFATPVDAELLDVAPHIDARGQEVRLGVTLPSGRPESLLWINQWQPKWETNYTLRRPVQLPAGSHLETQLTLHGPREAAAASSIKHLGRPIVAVNLVPVRPHDHEELVRAVQRKQIELARTPVMLERSWR